MTRQNETHEPDAFDVRLDRSVFGLGEQQFRAFVDHLTAPVVPNERLKRLLATPAPWDAADL